MDVYAVLCGVVRPRDKTTYPHGANLKVHDTHKDVVLGGGEAKQQPVQVIEVAEHDPLPQLRRDVGVEHNDDVMRCDIIIQYLPSERRPKIIVAKYDWTYGAADAVGENGIPSFKSALRILTNIGYDVVASDGEYIFSTRTDLTPKGYPTNNQHKLFRMGVPRSRYNGSTITAAEAIKKWITAAPLK
jgi:hypothetical protein